MNVFEKDILSGWVQLGIMFGVQPSGCTPDIERLLIDTAKILPSNARLLSTVVTWLGQYEQLVARHRLARMGGEIENAETSSALGLILDFARRQTGSGHLNIVIAQCKPVVKPKPLFNVDRKSPTMASLARDGSCQLSRKWRLWAQEPDVKSDAIRPAKWIMNHNPDLHYRAIFNGNLRASILCCLQAQPEAGNSESALARACGVTRKALRDALEHLQFCGLLLGKHTGWRNIIETRI